MDEMARLREGEGLNCVALSYAGSSLIFALADVTA